MQTSQYDKIIGHLRKLVPPEHQVTFFVSINKAADDPQHTRKFCNDLQIEETRLNVEHSYEPAILYTFRKRGDSSYHRAYSMFYHNKRCMDMVEAYQHNHNIIFDCIIKYRGDLYSDVPIPLPTNVATQTLYVPSGYDWGGLNDQIAYGDVPSMRKYSRCVDMVVELCRRGVEFHPESLLQAYINTTDLHVARFDYPYSICK